MNVQKALYLIIKDTLIEIQNLSSVLKFNESFSTSFEFFLTLNIFTFFSCGIFQNNP